MCLVSSHRPLSRTANPAPACAAVDVLPEKPNRTVPTQNPDASTIAAATQTLHNLAAAKASRQPMCSPPARRPPRPHGPPRKPGAHVSRVAPVRPLSYGPQHRLFASAPAVRLSGLACLPGPMAGQGAPRSGLRSHKHSAHGAVRFLSLSTAAQPWPPKNAPRAPWQEGVCPRVTHVPDAFDSIAMPIHTRPSPSLPLAHTSHRTWTSCLWTATRCR